ncbi:hypothetical protein DFH29DRAFT_998628 [Suillus ampliporus]|nr:hypothetical protein DFH29DRAFT_998628 [Suillus ampliporus]
MFVESAQCAVGTTVPPNTPNLTSMNGYSHYYTSPDPSPLLGAGGKDRPLNLSFEIVEDDEGIFISKAAAVWQGAIPKRAMIPLPVRARAMPTGTVQDHAVANLADPTSSNVTSTMIPPTCFQSISATPGLRSWSFEELRSECYSQSRLATGCAPRAVPPGAPSWMIIPPAFTPYKVMT